MKSDWITNYAYTPTDQIQAYTHMYSLKHKHTPVLIESKVMLHDIEQCTYTKEKRCSTNDRCWSAGFDRR